MSNKKIPDEVKKPGFSEGIKEPLIRRKTGERRPIKDKKVSNDESTDLTEKDHDAKSPNDD